MNTQFNGKGKAWRGSNPTRQLDGLSQPLTRRLEDLNEKELKELYDKTNTMLNNPALKLPDGGAKLKAKLEQIETLLNSTNDISDKVSDMSISDKLDIRKETVLRSNKPFDTHATNLLRAHDSDHTRTVRMMSLEESMQLQESQQKDIKLANMRKKMESVRKSAAANSGSSLADDLALNMNKLQLDPETRIPRPDDDGSSDGEGGDADSDSDSDEDDDLDNGYYERYDDEGFEEDEDQVFEDGQQHNNNNRRE